MDPRQTTAPGDNSVSAACDFACKCAQKSADMGNSRGLCWGISTHPNDPAGANGAKLSADQGDACGQSAYAMCLREGRGVSVDLTKALQYTKISAIQGNTRVYIDNWAADCLGFEGDLRVLSLFPSDVEKKEGNYIKNTVYARDPLFLHMLGLPRNITAIPRVGSVYAKFIPVLSTLPLTLKQALEAEIKTKIPETDNHTPHAFRCVREQRPSLPPTDSTLPK
jgi:hypothetical protein